MGSATDSACAMKLNSVLAAALISARLQCYGVVDTDVSTPAGGGYLERGQLRCTLEEWVYETGKGPEAMFFKPTTGGEFEVWAWDYHEPNIPWAECNGDIWYQNNDMGAGYCTPNKGYSGCGYADCVGTITSRARAPFSPPGCGVARAPFLKLKNRGQAPPVLQK